MQTVRAKFKLDTIQFSQGSRPVLDGSGKPVKDANGRDSYVPCKKATIAAYPVYGNGDPNHENTKFWQSSPSGKLELSVINAAAFEQFSLGQEFYLDFTAAGPAPDLR